MKPTDYESDDGTVLKLYDGARGSVTFSVDAEGFGRVNIVHTGTSFVDTAVHLSPNQMVDLAYWMSNGVAASDAPSSPVAKKEGE